MSEVIVNDGPEDRCFGCGHRNEQGLKLRFRVLENGDIETEYIAPEFFCGASGVVHGGIQATLLDEAMGISIHAAPGTEGLNAATVDFRLRYRRPTPTNAPLKIRSRLLRSEGRDYFVEGEIIDEAGVVLTRAEARWRSLE